MFLNYTQFLTEIFTEIELFIRTIPIELEFLIILRILILLNTSIDTSRHTVPFYNQFVLLNYMIYSQKKKIFSFFSLLLK